MLFHDYRAGHALDLSGNGNHGTLVGSPVWGRNGLSIELYTTQAVQVAHSDSINLLTQTIVILARQNRVQTVGNSSARIASKEVGATRCWALFFLNASHDIYWESSGGVSVFWAPARGLDGIYCYGFNMANGQVTPSYYDGLGADATSSGTGTIVQANAPLYIGNLSAPGRGFGGVMSSFLMFNRLLTADEHRTAYLELLK